MTIAAAPLVVRFRAASDQRQPAVAFLLGYRLGVVRGLRPDKHFAGEPDRVYRAGLAPEIAVGALVTHGLGFAQE